MPKTFSDRERAYIKERLLEETEKCLALYGIRRTTVDEIVQRVKIPKGTFYLFYASKEQLVFDVIMRVNDEMQEKLIHRVAALSGDVDAETLTEIIFGLYQAMDDSFLPKLIGDGELDLFMRRLPVELSRLHAKKDEAKTAELFTLLPHLKGEDVKVFNGALRGVFLSLLYKKEIGEDIFDETMRLLIRGVVLQMFEREKR